MVNSNNEGSHKKVRTNCDGIKQIAIFAGKKSLMSDPFHQLADWFTKSWSKNHGQNDHNTSSEVFQMVGKPCVNPGHKKVNIKLS